jgi:hypothetical protein
MPADECLTFARECRRWALETKDKDVREAFLEMAKVWTARLAAAAAVVRR